MKRFRFPLEIVKRLREHAEQEAQAELGRRIAAQAGASEARAARARALAAAHTELRAGGVSGHQLQLAAGSRDAALLRLAAADAAETAAGDAVERSRASLVEASRALETLDRLELARRDQHRRAVLAEEEATVQDLAEARRARLAVLARRGV
jgi:hypothetical protein